LILINNIETLYNSNDDNDNNDNDDNKDSNSKHNNDMILVLMLHR